MNSTSRINIHFFSLWTLFPEALMNSTSWIKHLLFSTWTLFAAAFMNSTSRMNTHCFLWQQVPEEAQGAHEDLGVTLRQQCKQELRTQRLYNLHLHFLLRVEGQVLVPTSNIANKHGHAEDSTAVWYVTKLVHIWHIPGALTHHRHHVSCMACLPTWMTMSNFHE